MFGQVSSRSMYDMEELRSIIQKMHRNPGLLTGGWKEYFYFLDEYFPTMRNDPSKLMLFLVEDCARCPLRVLKDVTDIFKTSRKKVKIEDYRRVSAAIARQPVDRSAAYLSVACLDLVSPFSEEEECTLLKESLERWQAFLYPEEDKAAASSFAACMAFLQREARDVSQEYPMTPNTALRLAAAVSRLVAWDTKYPKVRLDKRSARSTLARLLKRNIDRSVRVVRPLILGLFVVKDWMVVGDETMDARAEQFVDQYVLMALACCSNTSARLDLLAMNAILVLMGRFPGESAPDFLSEKLPCDPNDIPNDPRAFPMPEVSQDRHTRRGKNLTDTKNLLKKRCEEKGLEVPEDIEYSHGPPAHETKQGFEEFMEHIRACEDQMSDGKEPVFKEAALRMYRSLPEGVTKKRMVILKRRLPISEQKPPKQVSSKRKQKEDACHLEKKKRTNQRQEDS